MAQKLLKAGGKRKSAAKRPEKKTEDGSVVLVGTYHEKQLDWIKKSGVYNYPVKDGNDGRARTPAAPQDGNLIEFASKVKELWLYAGAKAKRHCFAAEFVGIQSKAEFLAANPTYAKKVGRPSHAQYAVFKTKPFDYGPKPEGKTVVARAIDFAKGRGQTKKIAAAIRQFHADGEFAPLAVYLPKELGKVPRPQLRVCEAAVQLDFLAAIFPAVGSDNESSKSSIEYICKSLGCKHGTPGWPDDFGSSLRMFFTQNSFRQIRTLSLFSGAGGLDIGFSDAGFDIIESVEIERKFCDTLELNSGEGKRFGHSKVNCVDIREFSGRDLGRIDFIIGGPPCQTFSAAGRRANGVLGTTDARGVLFREYIRLLQELRPTGFLFENVYGLTGAQGGEAWREIQDGFSEAGYKIFSRILDAADFGVPQHRERLIIVGVRTGDYKFPRPTHGPDSLAKTPFYTAGTAVRGLKLTAQEKKPGLGGRFGHLLDEIPPGLNYSYYTKEMGHPKPVFAWRSKFSDFLYKADPDAPVRTIKAQGGAYTGPLHWDNRFFAYSEYKRLQTFPDDYKISGGKQVAVHQIGNSVPPQLARMLAISIQEQLFGVAFPFQFNYLNPDERLTFRSRKLCVTEAYRRMARAKISNMPKVKSVCRPFSCEFFCRISDRFKFEKCESTEGDYKIAVKWDDDLTIEVADLGPLVNVRTVFTIEICPAKLAWDLPFSKIVLKSISKRINAFTIAWKALEDVISTKGLKADLVQLNGYYQYSPAFNSKCRFNEPFMYSDVISQIVSGENVRRIVSESELAMSWGVPENKVIDVAEVLRGIGYEIRNHKTNPQIEPGRWLIPYAFPTLNHMSVQLGKEIR